MSDAALRRSRFLFAAAVVGALSAAVSGCTPAAPPPLRVSAETFEKRIDTLCLYAPTSELALEHAAQRLGRLEELIAAELVASGYSVVGSTTIDRAWRAAAAGGPPLYDPHTGTPDRMRQETLTREVFGRLGCNAAAYPHVAVVRAPWTGIWADWDGAKREVSGAGGHGWVAALSLWMTIEDAGGREFYFNTGGLQIVAEFVPSGVFEAEAERIDPSLILVDETELRLGVLASLEPIRDAPELDWNATRQRWKDDTAPWRPELWELEGETREE